MRHAPGVIKLQMLQQLIDRAGKRLNGATLSHMDTKDETTIIIKPEVIEEGAWGWDGTSVHDAYEFLLNYDYLEDV